MKKIVLSLIFIALFSAISAVQSFYDGEKSKQPFREPMVMKVDVVRAIDLGLDNAAADIVWLSAIQYFGGGESKTNQALSPYLFLASELDPKFAYPYAFGALILPTIGQVDKGIELAKKGIDQKVDDWRIPYYLATTYYLSKNDPIEAAKYFDLSAHTRGAPENILQIAANFGSRQDRRAQTKLIWQGIYENSKDEVVQERAKNYIIHLEILDLLDQAVAEYNKKYNKYPTTLDDLVKANILKSIPPDPFGFEFIIGAEGKIGLK